jgi:hypothetical protein
VARADREQPLAGLDSDDFAEREQASRKLAAFEELAQPALRQARSKPSSLEQSRRIDALFRRLDHAELPAWQRDALALLERR